MRRLRYRLNQSQWPMEKQKGNTMAVSPHRNLPAYQHDILYLSWVLQMPGAVRIPS